MRELPLIFWQIPVEESDSPRFLVGARRELEAVPLAEPVGALASALESLRGDVIVGLFNQLTAAALIRPHLAPILMDALDSAIEQLTALSRHQELCALQEWLDEGQHD